MSNFVYFNSMNSPFELRIIVNITLIDPKSKFENILNHNDNERVVEKTLRFLIIEVDEKIKFNEFELEIEENFKIMWSTFNYYEIKGTIKS